MAGYLVAVGVGPAAIRVGATRHAQARLDIADGTLLRGQRAGLVVVLARHAEAYVCFAVRGREPHARAVVSLEPAQRHAVIFPAGTSQAAMGIDHALGAAV